MPVTAACTVLLTPDEYFAWEERQDVRHEYAYGEVFPMPGGTFNHFLIISNLVVAFRLALGDRPAFVLTDGMRVQVHDERYVYPDASVVLGAPAFRAGGRRTTLLNPAVVVEVSSRSTASYDRGEKLALYAGVSSVEAVVFVDAEAPGVQVARRRGEGWALGESVAEGAVAIEALGVSVVLADVYRLVEFEA